MHCVQFNFVMSHADQPQDFRASFSFQSFQSSASYWGQHPCLHAAIVYSWMSLCILLVVRRGSVHQSVSICGLVRGSSRLIWRRAVIIFEKSWSYLHLKPSKVSASPISAPRSVGHGFRIHTIIAMHSCGAVGKPIIRVRQSSLFTGLHYCDFIVHVAP